MPRLRLVVLVPLLLLGAVACGSDVQVLSAQTVASRAEDALEKKVGVRPDISCPKDLVAKVGATEDCTLTAGGDPTEYGVTVTVTSVDDGDTKFDVEVDSRPKG